MTRSLGEMEISSAITERMVNICARNTDEIGNLHINIIADNWDPKVEKLIEPFVYEVVGKFISSPH